MLPDTRVNAASPVLGEPIEVGPFAEGRVFVKVMDATATDDPDQLNVDVGISPSGYDDWDGHWHVLDTLKIRGEGMYSIPLDNFGNWLRLQLSTEGGTEYALQAWFVGKG